MHYQRQVFEVELAENLNVALPKTQDYWRKQQSLAGTSTDGGEG